MFVCGFLELTQTSFLKKKTRPRNDFENVVTTEALKASLSLAEPCAGDNADFNESSIDLGEIDELKSWTDMSKCGELSLEKRSNAVFLNTFTKRYFVPDHRHIHYHRDAKHREHRKQAKSDSRSPSKAENVKRESKENTRKPSGDTKSVSKKSEDGKPNRPKRDGSSKSVPESSVSWYSARRNKMIRKRHTSLGKYGPGSVGGQWRRGGHGSNYNSAVPMVDSSDIRRSRGSRDKSMNSRLFFQHFKKN